MESMTHPEILRAERSGMPEGSTTPKLRFCPACSEYTVLTETGVCGDCMTDKDATISQLISKIGQSWFRNLCTQRDAVKELDAVIDAARQAQRRLLA